MMGKVIPCFQTITFQKFGYCCPPRVVTGWKSFIPSQTAAHDSHIHSQSFQGFWTMHTDKKEPNVYTAADDTFTNFLFIMWCENKINFYVLMTSKGYHNFFSQHFLGLWHDIVTSLIVCEKQHPLGTPRISLLRAWVTLCQNMNKTEVSCRKKSAFHTKFWESIRIWSIRDDCCHHPS